MSTMKHSAGRRFRDALAVEQPLQVVGECGCTVVAARGFVGGRLAQDGGEVAAKQAKGSRRVGRAFADVVSGCKGAARTFATGRLA